MSIFDIDFNNKAVELLPPTKRTPKMVAFVQALLSQIQVGRDKYLGEYRTGTTAPQWVAGTYGINQIVIYKQVVYISLVAGNTDQPPSVNWQVYLPSFIGVDKRVKFNGRLVTLTYALNQYFFTNFRQPLLYGWASSADSTHALYSDIYINNSAVAFVGFLVGQTIGSTVAQHDIASYTAWAAGSYSIGNLVVKDGHLYLSLTNANISEPPSVNWHKTETVAPLSLFERDRNFTIFVPTALYVAENFAATNDSNIRNFVDKLIPAGLRYTVQAYIALLLFGIFNLI